MRVDRQSAMTQSSFTVDCTSQKCNSTLSALLAFAVHRFLPIFTLLGIPDASRVEDTRPSALAKDFKFHFQLAFARGNLPSSPLHFLFFFYSLSLFLPFYCFIRIRIKSWQRQSWESALEALNQKVSFPLAGIVAAAAAVAAVACDLPVGLTETYFRFPGLPVRTASKRRTIAPRAPRDVGAPPQTSLPRTRSSARLARQAPDQENEDVKNVNTEVQKKRRSKHKIIEEPTVQNVQTIKGTSACPILVDLKLRISKFCSRRVT